MVGKCFVRKNKKEHVSAPSSIFLPSFLLLSLGLSLCLSHCVSSANNTHNAKTRSSPLFFCRGDRLVGKGGWRSATHFLLSYPRVPYTKLHQSLVCLFPPLRHSSDRHFATHALLFLSKAKTDVARRILQRDSLHLTLAYFGLQHPIDLYTRI